MTADNHITLYILVTEDHIDPDAHFSDTQEQFELFQNAYMDHLCDLLCTRFQPPFFGTFSVRASDGDKTHLACNHRECHCETDILSYAGTERVHLDCLTAAANATRTYREQQAT